MHHLHIEIRQIRFRIGVVDGIGGGTFGPPRRGSSVPAWRWTKGAAVGVVDSVSGIYLGWGSFTIQLGNLIVITIMIVLFVLALLLPFPKVRRRS